MAQSGFVEKTEYVEMPKTVLEYIDSQPIESISFSACRFAIVAR